VDDEIHRLDRAAIRAALDEVGMDAAGLARGVRRLAEIEQPARLCIEDLKNLCHLVFLSGCWGERL